ncbi:TRAP transporter substrate-binding protein [Aquibaculum sediminis]|uniref:TRAP transporter substrate-binding protein n=1 Tax=Aquibaculum sediminis TaxID=3231907 RepID=UPI003452C563
MVRTNKLAVLAAVMGVLSAGAASAQETLTFGGSDAVGSLIDKANLKFTELVNERAKGQLKVNFIQGEQLGNDIDVIQQMMQGSVDVYGDVLDWYGNWVQDFNILNWGFTFRDNDHMQAFLESDLYGELTDELRQEHGLRILAAAPTQPRVLFATKRIESPEDLQDLKMRVPEIRAYLLLWETLGTRPSRVAWSEIFLGLSTGTIEGAEGPVSAAYAQKMHEPAPYVIRTDHLVATHHITMSEESFQSLAPEMQEIVQEAAEEAVRWVRAQADEETEEIVQQMADEGATVVEVDREPFAERALSGVEEMEEAGTWSKGLWERVRNM